MKQDKILNYGKWIEASTWIVMILVIFGVRFLPQKLVDNNEAYLFIGVIVSLALFYYLIVYRYFNKTNRMYIKDIADIVLIGVLIHLLKDYGQFFFALYFLPIAASALTMEFMSALIIAIFASVFVVFEIFLNSYSLLPGGNSSYFQGVWQIGLILLITIFCRFLAVQLREEKRAKEEALAREKLLEEEAMREKDFMSLTSHQLYTPLSIIRGFAAMLKDQTFGKLTPKQLDAVTEIHQNTKRMVALVSELLSISKVETSKIKLHYTETNPTTLIRDIIANFSQMSENKKVALVTDITNNSNSIEIDSDKIRQVIYNLIDNALKYTTTGEIKVGFVQDPKHTTFSVKDSGIGIATEDHEKIFEPFFRGKNILELDNKGTGLGLHIAKLIVKKHGGHIWFTSKENRGTTFSFSVPNKIKEEQKGQS